MVNLLQWSNRHLTCGLCALGVLCGEKKQRAKDRP